MAPGFGSYLDALTYDEEVRALDLEDALAVGDEEALDDLRRELEIALPDWRTRPPWNRLQLS